MIKQDELQKTLAEHQEWLEKGVGKRANFSNMDLSGIKFDGIKLTEAIFAGANLKNTDFSGCNLRSADFGGANLENARFEGALMRWVFLKNANLRRANLFETDLFFATLDGADLREALFKQASLSGAGLRKVILDDDVSLTRKLWSYAVLDNATIDDAALSKIVPNRCLPGRIIGYKKVKGVGDGAPLIAMLEIPADARRVNSTSRQCRCDKARVLSITHSDGTSFEGEEAVGWIFPKITYKVGEMVAEAEFSDDRRTNMAKGIHFFLSREEAERFGQ